jgi:serine/threonine protein kinase
MSGAGSGEVPRWFGVAGLEADRGTARLFPEDAHELPRPFGKYTLVSELGRGGMAEVFLALHRSSFGMEKLLVLKCMRPSLRDHSRFIKMFINEARTAATLTHPNIVQVFDAGEVDGDYFIAMEYVEGADLGKLLRTRRARTNDPFPIEHALHIIVETLSGLAHAHQKKDLSGLPLALVHRDISPHNLLLAFDGNVKIVDFGISKSALHDSAHSIAGEVKGKVRYLSPEQALVRPIDHRTDLFAVAVILFELTTGTRLFPGPPDVNGIRRMHDSDYPPPNLHSAGYPEELELIVMRGLEKDPDRRYQSAREMQRDLLRFADSAGLTLSESSFADWLQGELSSALDEQQCLLRQVRDLAWSARHRTSRATVSATSLTPPAEWTDTSSAIADRESVDGPPSVRPCVSTMAPTEQPYAQRPRRNVRLLLGAAAISVGGWFALGQPAAPRAFRTALEQKVVGPVQALWAPVLPEAPPKPVGSTHVSLEVVPTNALVWLDETPLTTRRIAVSVGERHRLRISAPGFVTQLVDIDLRHPSKPIRVILEPLESSAETCDSPSGGTESPPSEP